MNVYAKQNILTQFAAANGHTFFTFISQRDFLVSQNRERFIYGEMQIVEDDVKLLWDEDVPAL